MILWQVGPLQVDWVLQCLHTPVRGSTCPGLQNTPNSIVQGFQVWAGGRPHCLVPEMGEKISHQRFQSHEANWLVELPWLNLGKRTFAMITRWLWGCWKKEGMQCVWGSQVWVKFFLNYAEMQHFLDCLTHAPSRCQADKSPGLVTIKLSMVLAQLLLLQNHLNSKSAPCTLQFEAK